MSYKRRFSGADFTRDDDDGGKAGEPVFQHGVGTGVGVGPEKVGRVRLQAERALCQAEMLQVQAAGRLRGRLVGLRYSTCSSIFVGQDRNHHQPPYPYAEVCGACRDLLRIAPRKFVLEISSYSQPSTRSGVFFSA